MEREIKYLGLMQNGEMVGTMQTILQDEELIDFIDEIFDMGLNLTKIDKETYIWKPGMPKWELSVKIPEILKLVALIPPPF